ncbi:hypothetical protein BCR39DRAFT_519042 [Naematelia encephala]|uniref:Myb-like domain-containing protein n=1 Tax=Naematelia encephala TaxID=71784 RepID=A0A1Y2BG17_9TREE|nr:hypothetical protein BCR39DRAFT_519042 [Naematelia encephala]
MSKNTAKPDWQAIGSTLDKTSTQCFDLYRKSLLPALHSGKPWATTTSAWTSAEKVQLLDKVLKTTTTDWEDLASTFPDRTKAQIYDVWRKVIMPKLKNGEVVA